jgi:hypothetical protein
MGKITRARNPMPMPSQESWTIAKPAVVAEGGIGMTPVLSPAAATIAEVR